MPLSRTASESAGFALGAQTSAFAVNAGRSTAPDRDGRPLFGSLADTERLRLGLATVQSIVEQAGGHISVSSEVGKGTSFQG
jgi:hypothetical protein